MSAAPSGLACACAAAAFPAAARALGLWTGELSAGAALAAAAAGAGLLGSRLLPPPSGRAAGWWSLAAALAGPALAVWTRLAGLSASDPELLGYARPAPAAPLLAPAALLFLLLGRAARAAGVHRPLDAALPALALGASALALRRLDPALVLALATAPLLLAAPRRAALAGLLAAALAAWHARAAFTDAWTLRLDHLYTGWTWLSPPRGEEALAAVRFPDGRSAVLRAGKLEFEDHVSARLAMVALLGQHDALPESALLVSPRGPDLPAAARAAGLGCAVVDPSPEADRLTAALWPETPDPAWTARSAPPPRPGLFGALAVRVAGRGSRDDRAGVADRAALRRWRRRLAPEAPAALLLPGHAEEADVAAAAADAEAVFGHARVADLPAAVLVLASPAPVETSALLIAARLPSPALQGWEPAVALQRALAWRPTAP